MIKRLLLLLALGSVTVAEIRPSGGAINRTRISFGSGGVPSSVITDNFDSYANGANLGAQTNWATYGGTGAIIVNTAGGGKVMAEPGNGNRVCRRTDSTLGANQYAQVTFHTAASGAMGPAIRCQAVAFTCYEAHYDVAATTVYVGCIVGGTWNAVATIAATPLAAGNSLRIEATGTGAATRITVRKDIGSGWVTILNSQDPGVGLYIDGGVPGVYAYSETLSADSFEAGEL